jgi:RHS repeat-associated protein
MYTVKALMKSIERGAYGADNQWHWYFLNQDHEGSVTHLTDSNGAIIERYRYDTFGAPSVYAPNWTTRTGSSFNNRFLFTGREYLGAWVYDYRTRVYHAYIGRFMSEDPKLFDAGDYNLFRYCDNDPLDFTDPMGLESPAWAQAAIPGVYEYDQVVANVHAGNYGTAIGWFATMLVQQYVGVVTMGRSTQAQASFRATRAAMAERQIAAVIGKFKNSPNYLQVAENLRVKALDIPIKIWERMSPSQQWAANQKFLDRAIARGGDIILDKPIKDINGVSGQLRNELNYLSQKGYQLSEDGSRMVRSPQFEAALTKGTEEAQEHSSNLIHSKPDPSSR